MLSAKARKARAELATAAAQASRSPDDPEAIQVVEERRRQYRYVAARDYVQDLIEAAPPLTESQRSRLAVLLLGGGADA